jgi:hypothetical protein
MSGRGVGCGDYLLPRTGATALKGGLTLRIGLTVG